MSLKTLLQARLMEQFKSAKLNGAHHLSPRNGYFFIKEVNYRDFSGKGKVPIATVLWKLNEADFFLKDIPFEISLSSLILSDPLEYLNLAKKTILIADVELVLTSSLANPRRIEFKYQVINRRPNVTTSQFLLLESFMGNATTLLEAYNRYEQDLGIELSEAIFDEASNVIYDDQQNDDVIYDDSQNDKPYDEPRYDEPNDDQQ